MKKILLQSFVRVIFLYISMFLLYILSWLIFDYAFPISWRAEIVILLWHFALSLLAFYGKCEKTNGSLAYEWSVGKNQKRKMIIIYFVSLLILMLVITGLRRRIR